MPSTNDHPVRTVLAAVAEPTDVTQPVLERAAELAEAYGARLVLFHAAFDSALSGRPFFDSKRLARSRGSYIEKQTVALTRHIRALKLQALETQVHVVWEEPAHEAIIRAVIREDADLVLAGPHAARPGRAPTLRQTDWQLMRLCPRPLLLIRSTHRGGRGPILAALDPAHANDKPAALDHLLADQGAQLAESLGVELHAVHCVPANRYALAENTAADRRKARERMQSRMKRVLKRLDLPASRIHVLHGSPEDQIPQLVQKLEAQVLVMGTLSRRGLQRFAIGDTAERIVDSVSCDLLVLKPKGFRIRLGKANRESVS